MKSLTPFDVTHTTGAIRLQLHKHNFCDHYSTELEAKRNDALGKE